MASDSASLEKYLYELPEDRIAKHPLANRDDSKLLLYQGGQIHHESFKQVVDLVPANSLLFLNNTKVIAARLFFQKATGAQIEIFLTEPILPHTEFQQALKAKNTCTWKCMVGNLKKWKDENVLSLRLNDEIEIEARLVDREKLHVTFSWAGDQPFLDVIEAAGHVPLPPYLNREEEADDKDRYQTVFSELEGAVAAPTAGLHFTDDILTQLNTKGVKQDRVTLHVSAGTFRPIKDADFKKHDMHNERIIVSRTNIENILGAQGLIIPVGTTALRTLESLYWYGVKLTKDSTAPFFVEKDDPYKAEFQEIPLSHSMKAIIEKMDRENITELKGETEIFIYPGYKFRVATGLFTNFHMPASTLVLLVAAFVGDKWRSIYEEALSNSYRFLSYGDTSLLLP
ncbi:S-adenosylmethionine:tRNA ribosyltransferase-isomerase [Reichenbachiella carrageenanivorans]|uniref:S-adenosylmethionine:tRNA ribosyltransferase-isomerase n=1 Tax=Reichenbachiella carrageenanivorans TaxID=2979869 RepID=A0ABY6D6F6_9BACT|nr:S-adenosylmethionine:tRNA ribosyltransferase-isomerase [Reichenbachiella carrageenanivorans]UXX81195.1 S-adenosylmethionine:tRNA ribosyltransferase-isomerase [Reichenbachiella carrageenanivorans]